MPDEPTAALAASAAGRRTFAPPTPRPQKAWTRRVAEAKASDPRARRAADARRIMAAGRKAGETDALAPRRGIATTAAILARP